MINMNWEFLKQAISQTDEMEKLEEIIRPTIGIFTNIGELTAKVLKTNSKRYRRN